MSVNILVIQAMAIVYVGMDIHCWKVSLEIFVCYEYEPKHMMAPNLIKSCV